MKDEVRSFPDVSAGSQSRARIDPGSITGHSDQRAALSYCRQAILCRIAAISRQWCLIFCNRGQLKGQVKDQVRDSLSEKVSGVPRSAAHSPVFETHFGTGQDAEPIRPSKLPQNRSAQAYNSSKQFRGNLILPAIAANYGQPSPLSSASGFYASSSGQP